MRNMTLPDPTRTRQVADTGVGVLDRAVAILDAVEHGSAGPIAAVVRATGLSRIDRPPTPRVPRGARPARATAAGAGIALGPRLLKLAAMALRELSLRDARASRARAAGGGDRRERPALRYVDRRARLHRRRGVLERAPHDRADRRGAPATGGVRRRRSSWPGDAARPGRGAVRRARPLTPATPTGDRLRRQLATARRQGWATSAGERRTGVASVSAPVAGPRGEVDRRGVRLGTDAHASAASTPNAMPRRSSPPLARSKSALGFGYQA